MPSLLEPEVELDLDPEIQDLVNQNYLTQQQAEDLGGIAADSLRNPRIRQLLTQGDLTIAQVLTLDNTRARVLGREDLFELITLNLLTVPQVLALTHMQGIALLHPHVPALIRDHVLTVEQALALNEHALDALRNEGVLELMFIDELTFELLAAITTRHQAEALQNPQNQVEILRGVVTIEEVLELAPPAINNINNPQSTHTASVHASVSESALKLMDRYRLSLEAEGLEQVIERVKAYVNSLNNSLENNAAKACISRITTPDYEYVDPSSQVTIKQLVALVFLAIQDNALRQGSLEDALAAFIKCLYEIERGYNFTADGKDRGGPSRPICSAGTLNALIAALRGIHPDCEIRYITHSQASNKFPLVVYEEAKNYLASLANPPTMKAFRAFAQLIVRIKEEESLEVIWSVIQNKVTDRIWEEFGSLYLEKTDPRLTGLMRAVEYLPPPNFNSLKEQVKNSKAYYQYCSRMLSQFGLFSSSLKPDSYLIEHRHDSPELQEEYDQKFGLVLSNK